MSYNYKYAIYYLYDKNGETKHGEWHFKYEDSALRMFETMKSIKSTILAMLYSTIDRNYCVTYIDHNYCYVGNYWKNNERKPPFKLSPEEEAEQSAYFSKMLKYK